MGLKRKWKRRLAAGGALLVVLGVILALAAGRIGREIRGEALRAIGDRLDSRIELEELHVSFFPRLRVTGEGLVVRHRGDEGYPPLIRVKRFVGEGGLSDWGKRPWRIGRVVVTGLEIHIPPKRAGAIASIAEHAELDIPMVIAELSAPDANLEVIPRDAGKQPLEFAISHLEIWSLGVGRAASFHADLINPVPEGAIHTIGTFGPWNAAVPSETPVAGSYELRDADLGTLRGIEGTLEAQGSYTGRLDEIRATGRTRVPNFALDKVGHAMELEADYDAVVDGRNGDVELNDVEARLGESPLECSGKIEGRPGEKGRSIHLEMAATQAQLADLLRLATRATPPPMTGITTLKATLDLPTGEEPVLDRMTLAGSFGVGAVKFAQAKVESKVNELSRRGQGKPGEVDLTTNVSDLKGAFILQKGIATFQNLTFNVTGASVHLAGDYNLRAETLDFSGTLRLQAKLSQTVTGVKSIFLKAVDPFFAKKGAGTVLPIKITGTREDPKFGLKLH